MGYGDDLMVTGEVNELLKTRPKAKFIIGDGKNRFGLKFIIITILL